MLIFLCCLLSLLAILVTFLSCCKDPLHQLLIVRNFFDCFWESFNQDQVGVVWIKLKQFLKVHVRFWTLSDTSSLQILKEIFGLNYLNFTSTILPWWCLLLSFNHLFIDNTLKEVMQRHIEFH